MRSHPEDCSISDGWEGEREGVGLAPPRPPRVDLLAQAEWLEHP